MSKSAGSSSGPIYLTYLRIYNYIDINECKYKDLDIPLRPDVNQSRWLQVSRRASHQLWRPELSLAGLVGVTRLELAQVTCDWSAAAPAEL